MSFYKQNKFFIIILSISSIIILWWILSLFFNPTYLPSPLIVFIDICKIIISGEFFKHMLSTIIRIIIGFGIAMILSLFIGVAMGKNKKVEDFLKIEILVGLTIPALAWSIISIMWFGLKNFSAVFAISVLITPMIVLNIYHGMKSLDNSLIEMGKVYNASKYLILKKIIIPQLLPYIFSGSRYGLALAWKTVVIVEMLGLTSGIGYKIAFWFGLFSMENVLAWTLLFTGIMFIIEYLILSPIEKKVMDWRQSISF